MNLTLNLKIMKFPNYLISSLAIVGAFSLIIMACSADNSNSTNNVNTAGRYQITALNGNNYAPFVFYVIDTETGVVKTYKSDPHTGNGAFGANTYTLTSTTITQ